MHYIHTYLYIIILMQTLPALKKKKIVIHNDLYSDTVTQIHYVKREHNIHVNMYHFDVLYYFTSYTFLP